MSSLEQNATPVRQDSSYRARPTLKKHAGILFVVKQPVESK